MGLVFWLPSCPTPLPGCPEFSRYVSVHFAIPRTISPTRGAGPRQGLPIVMETIRPRSCCQCSNYKIIVFLTCFFLFFFFSTFWVLTGGVVIFTWIAARECWVSEQGRAAHVPWHLPAACLPQPGSRRTKGPTALGHFSSEFLFLLNARPAWQGCTDGASYKGRSMIKQDVLPFLLKYTISLPNPRKSRVGRAHGPYLPVVFSYVCSWSSRTEKKGRNSLQPQFSPSQKGKTSFLSLWYTLHDFRTSSFDSSLNVKNMRLWGGIYIKSLLFILLKYIRNVFLLISQIYGLWEDWI